MSNWIDGGALSVAAVALFVSFRANRNARRSALAAERQAHAAEASVPPPPPPVAWRLDHQHRDRFVLRNIGTTTATGVQIDVPPGHDPTRLRVDWGASNGTVAPGAGVEVWDYHNFGQPFLYELQINWAGAEQPILVPVPAADRSIRKPT